MFNSLIIGHSFVYHLEHRLTSKHTTWRDPENSEGKVSVQFYGLRGATISKLAQDMSNYHLNYFYRPRVVMLVASGNDISCANFDINLYEAAINTIYDQCLSFDSDLVVMWVWKRLKPRSCNVDVYNSRRAEVHRLYEQKACKLTRMYFYPARGTAFNLKNLGKDGVHPSDDGYQILSNTISRALGWYMWKSGNLN